MPYRFQMTGVSITSQVGKVCGAVGRVLLTHHLLPHIV